MKPFFLTGCLLVSLLLAGCQGSGRTVTLQLNKMNAEAENTGSNLAVAVSSFSDQRPSADHLGVRIHQGGEKTYFDLMDGNVSPHLTRAFLDFLNNSGFSAKAAESATSPDVTIDAVVRTFNVKATDSLFASSLEVNVLMEFTIRNLTDKSTIRVTSAAGGTYEDFIFDVEDLEELMTDALKEGFEELLEETEVQGKALRRRV